MTKHIHHSDSELSVDAEKPLSKEEEVSSILTRSLNLILKPTKMKDGEVEYDYLESSESPEEVRKALKIDPQAKDNRREYKAAQLAAIASTFFPSSDKDRTEVQKIQQARKKAYKEHALHTPNAPFEYEDDVKDILNAWIEERQENSLYHNPYFRRAFRDAVPVDKVLEGGSANYANYQKKIRTSLYKILQEDHKEMKWTKDDFSSEEEWKAVAYMLKNVISNNSSVTTTGVAILNNAPIKRTSPRMAFHHVAWKEGCDGIFSSHALNMVNLMALNDQRTSEKHPERAPGDHENAHEIMGFKVGCNWSDTISSKGGIFAAMDIHAVEPVLATLAQKRPNKIDLYTKQVHAHSTTGTTKPKTLLEQAIPRKDNGKHR